MRDDATKIALVTGGRSGIGQACARALAADGVKVITVQRGEDPEFDCIRANLSHHAAPREIIEEVIRRQGRLDIVVNNAGLMKEGSALEMSEQDWLETINVNLTAPFLLIKHALPYLIETKGAIVNIGSIEGLGSNPRHPAYCASKGGLHALTRAIAVDHGPQDVRCNGVAPGWIDTDLNLDFIESLDDPDEFRRKIGGIHPLGRTGKPEEVGALVAFLASDKASFVTGQIWTVDGGRMTQLSLP